MPPFPDTATVLAARAGDPAALDRLAAGVLPLVYNLVGRALGGHADVDDVVQETMSRLVHGLGQLAEPARFRDWLVAIAVRQVRDRHRAGLRAPAPGPAWAGPTDPGGDFADLTVARLELSGQRRHTALAARWLDAEDRKLLALWWLEAGGELHRDDIVAAFGVTRPHAAVRIQRMRVNLDTARAVVAALEARPPCPDLFPLASGWDGVPAPLWRDRFVQHIRGCDICQPSWAGLVDAERLLVGLALVPPSGPLAGTAASDRTGPVGPAAPPMARWRWPVVARGLVAVAAIGAVLLAGAAAFGYYNGDGSGTRKAFAAPVAPPTTDATGPDAGTAAEPLGSGKPSARPSRSTARKPGAKPRPAPGGTARAAKKGVSTWKFPGVTDALRDVGAAWFYNWSPSSGDTPAPGGVEFVPMIWGAKSVNTATLDAVQREGKTLLGFNEPDLGEQSSMSVEQALELWPRLQGTGMRLGSPSVAFGADTNGGWLDRFMKGAADRGYRVDFITLHWYGSDFSPAAVGHLRNYLEATYQKYRLPIWVTEYGLINFGGSPRYPSAEQQVAFINGSTAMMQGLTYVERYAYFSLPAVGDSAAYGLYRDGSSPTAAGVAYRAAGGR